MKKIEIFEPAMCCSTGLCGVGVDQELLRISTVINTLQNNDIIVERFNLSSAPQEFIKNKVVNDFIREKGVEGLPLTVADGEIVLSGRYPKNEEFVEILGIPLSVLGKERRKIKATMKKSGGCGCSDGNCC